MSEPKRVALQSVPTPTATASTSTSTAGAGAAAADGKPAAKKKSSEKKDKQTAPTIRFSLNLFESNDHKYPEFNYAELLKNAERRNKRDRKKDEGSGTLAGSSNGGTQTPSGNPFDDDDEDDQRVLDVARYFESKYGNRKKSDYVDLGAGYDESDPFIDNTDVYDELVPEEVTTAHGGFYVNSGPLEFKDSDSAAILLARRNSLNNNVFDDDDDDEEESSEEDSEEENSVTVLTTTTTTSTPMVTPVVPAAVASTSKIRPVSAKRPLSSDNEEIDISLPAPPKSKPRKVIEAAVEYVNRTT